MTLKQAPYYWLECDGCGDLSTEHSEFTAWQDFGYAIDSALDWDWQVYTFNDKDVHLCPDCTPQNEHGEPWEEIPDTILTFDNALIGQKVMVRHGNIPFIPADYYIKVSDDLWLEVDIDENTHTNMDEDTFEHENYGFRTLDGIALDSIDDWNSLSLGTVLLDYGNDEWIKTDHHLASLLLSTNRMKTIFEIPHKIED